AESGAVGCLLLRVPPCSAGVRGCMDAFGAAIDAAAANVAIKAIVVRSASERFFSAGADVSVFAKSDFDTKNAFVVCANETMSKLEQTPKVVIAAINGHCLGGGFEIALCCDFRIAAEG